MATGDFGGSCLCGAVVYELDVAPRVTVACHCSLCRKSTGSAFGVWSLVPRDHFRWISGESALHEFNSTDHGRRLFCKHCGTTLGSVTARRPHFMHIAAGTFDRAPPLRIGLHAYTASKVDWYTIADEAPQHDDEPEPA
jgi:hypothetical protein